MSTAHHLAVHILDEPAPCDDCHHAELCKFTGAACKVFSAYIQGQPWEGVERNPTLKRGKALGIEAAELTDADRARLLERLGQVSGPIFSAAAHSGQ